MSCYAVHNIAMESPPHSTDAMARAVGFSQCVDAVRRTLVTTPVGWALVTWFCWNKVPQHLIWIWLGLSATLWLTNLSLLNRVIRSGSVIQLHSRALLLTAAFDGLGWGLIVILLMGHNPVLDALMVTVLCGITAINSQVYMTYLRGFYAQEGALWVAAIAGFARLIDQPGVLDYAVGYSVFVALMIYYMIPITRRLLDGTRLQLANASLAEQLRVALSVEQRDASTDALTGQGNRRALDALLVHQMEIAERTGQAFSVLMLDIDFFKKINDDYGHMVGDDALRAFALRVREYLRQGDVCARYGGEEFVIVLPGAPLQKALEVAERIRMGVAQAPLLLTPLLHATVSIGAATLEPGQTLESLLQAADAAMYAAKRGGRNQVRS